KKISEINTSVYCFDARRLWPALAEIRPDNDQGELYLTDVIGVLARAGAKVEAVTVADPVEAMGINDRKQLAALAGIQRRRILDRLMAEGVTVVDPASTYVDDTVTIGPDSVVHPQTVIVGATTIGEACVIGAGSHVSDSTLADRVTLKPYSMIETAVIEDGAFVGTNSSLVAPLTIGAGAYVAAGSVITKDVPADALALERSQTAVK